MLMITSCFSRYAHIDVTALMTTLIDSALRRAAMRVA